MTSGESSDKVVILGGGHAAGSAASFLRQFGHTGPIIIVGEEPLPPYQRPPLSKAYLKGELSTERLHLRPRSFYDESHIELRLGMRATAIDLVAKQVQLADGSDLAYDKLILATGSRARQPGIPGLELAGVGVVRSVADVDQLQQRIRPGSALAIVGAGYIGLEVAAVARQLQVPVAVVESLPRVLARVTSPPVSEFMLQQHRQHGVQVHLGAQVVEFQGHNGQVAAIRLADGAIVEAPTVVLAVGILPNVELAQTAGLICEDGIVVDEDARTSDPHVFAIGDCANRPLVHYGRRGRLESVHNAVEQAKLASSAISAKPRPACDLPWFWSDQYDLKLQTVGLAAGHDQWILRGSMEHRKFAIYYLRDGKVLAVDAINSPADFVAGKKLIAASIHVDVRALSDPSVDLKALLVPPSDRSI